MPDPTCFKCNSKFKVTQVEPGIYCCGGFCLKHYRQRKDMALEKGKMAPSAPQETSLKFKVGDFCRGTYAEDGVEYEGKIIAMQQEPSSRDEYATVLFLGYGNEATLWTSELKPSLGEEARSKQADAAAQEETPAEATLKPKSRQWNVDDPCRSIYSVDQIEYEGVIKDIKADPDSGSKYAIVEFIGYGNQETVWFEDLMASSGESARMKQIAEAGADSSSSSPERSSPTVWKAGDRCRAIFSEDHLEYEGVLTTVDASEDGKKYATIEFYGYGNVETVWVDDLLPSQVTKLAFKVSSISGYDYHLNYYRATKPGPSKPKRRALRSPMALPTPTPQLRRPPAMKMKNPSSPGQLGTCAEPFSRKTAWSTKVRS